MLVSIIELAQTSLYPEIINKISRNDDSATERHILDAESFVRSFMSKYDLDAIFGTTESEPTYKGSDVNLIKKMVKIIASYYMVRKSNPNVDIELFRADYEDALLWLEKLQEGKVNPDLPYKPDNPDTPGSDTSDTFWASLPKQNNFF